jgi:hypothetical protein
MFLPAQYAWFEPVLIASIVVFIIDLIGNWITFSNRYLSSLVSAGLVYFGYGSVSMSLKATPSASAPASKGGG